MTIHEWLRSAEAKLKLVNLKMARLDCLVLLQDATGKDKSYILAHLENDLTALQINQLTKQIIRRADHEPLAYIRGHVEFYGRKFIVNKNVLVPRPETEAMIELLEQLVKSQKSKVVKNFTIIDVGTGSGCLAITAKLECPTLKIMATDISPACLKIAEQNAKMLGAEVTCYQGDLLRSLPSTVYRLPPTIILANLPYVPDTHPINQAATHEPSMAIFGGSDGLDLYQKLFEQAAELKFPPIYILTESLPFQHEELVVAAKAHKYKLDQANDLVQCFKFTNS